MKRETVYRWDYENMDREERDRLFWDLIRYLGLEVYKVKYDGEKTEFEFEKEW